MSTCFLVLMLFVALVTWIGIGSLAWWASMNYQSFEWRWPTLVKVVDVFIDTSLGFVITTLILSLHFHLLLVKDLSNSL